MKITIKNKGITYTVESHSGEIGIQEALKSFEGMFLDTVAGGEKKCDPVGLREIAKAYQLEPTLEDLLSSLQSLRDFRYHLYSLQLFGDCSGKLMDEDGRYCGGFSNIEGAIKVIRNERKRFEG